jgi:hypothetical protein
MRAIEIARSISGADKVNIVGQNMIGQIHSALGASSPSIR